MRSKASVSLCTHPADCRELALPVTSVQVLRPSLKAGGVALDYVAFTHKLNSTSDCDKQTCSCHPWCSLSVPITVFLALLKHWPRLVSNSAWSRRLQQTSPWAAACCRKQHSVAKVFRPWCWDLKPRGPSPKWSKISNWWLLTTALFGMFLASCLDTALTWCSP